jgi:hypothetical protein
MNDAPPGNGRYRPARGMLGRRNGGDLMLTCAWCGAAAVAAPLGWTVEFTRRGPRYMCDRCSRENLNAIEGRLETELF